MIDIIGVERRYQMIITEMINVNGFEAAITGMRNPMNSWKRSDSKKSPDGTYKIGENDLILALKLAAQGSVHGKYLRMISVYANITAPLYWWKEFDTYKVGTVANSCSTMHKIHDKEFVLDDFSHDHLDEGGLYFLKEVISTLNDYRDLYIGTSDKKYWWSMIQLLPSSYNQKRTVMMDYEVLSNIYCYRRNHKLDEWRDFCRWIEESLPYPELITCRVKEEENDKSGT